MECSADLEEVVLTALDARPWFQRFPGALVAHLADAPSVCSRCRGRMRRCEEGVECEMCNRVVVVAAVLQARIFGSL